MLLEVLNARVDERCKALGLKVEDLDFDGRAELAFEEWCKLMGKTLPDDPEAACALRQQFEWCLAEQEKAAGLPGVGEKRTPPPPPPRMPVWKLRRRPVTPRPRARARMSRRRRSLAGRLRRATRAGPDSDSADDHLARPSVGRAA